MGKSSRLRPHAAEKVNAMRHKGTTVKFIATREQELPVPSGLQVRRSRFQGVEVAILSHTLQRPRWPEGLTPAEREVGELLLAGLRRVHIAEKRNVSIHTVNNQIRALFQKLRIHSRSELARAAIPAHLPVSPS